MKRNKQPRRSIKKLLFLLIQKEKDMLREVNHFYGDSDEPQGEEINSEGKDKGDAKAAAIIVTDDDRILCAKRTDNGLICGGGGHIEEGESSATAAIRELDEEFGIIPNTMEFLGTLEGTDNHLKTDVFLTNDYQGVPKADDDEMTGTGWLSLGVLRNLKLFPAFEESLKFLEAKAKLNEKAE